MQAESTIWTEVFFRYTGLIFSHHYVSQTSDSARECARARACTHTHTPPHKHTTNRPFMKGVGLFVSPFKKKQKHGGWVGGGGGGGSDTSNILFMNGVQLSMSPLKKKKV